MVLYLLCMIVEVSDVLESLTSKPASLSSQRISLTNPVIFTLHMHLHLALHNHALNKIFSNT